MQCYRSVHSLDRLEEVLSLQSALGWALTQLSFGTE